MEPAISLILFDRQDSTLRSQSLPHGTRPRFIDPAAKHHIRSSFYAEACRFCCLKTLKAYPFYYKELRPKDWSFQITGLAPAPNTKTSYLSFWSSNKFHKGCCRAAVRTFLPLNGVLVYRLPIMNIVRFEILRS